MDRGLAFCDERTARDGAKVSLLAMSDQGCEECERESGKDLHTRKCKGDRRFRRLYSSDVLEELYYMAGIVTAATSVLGLIGLVVYARETWKMRKAAEDQVENMIKPCVLFMENPPGEGQVGGFDDKGLFVRNVGKGPAINIRWRTVGNTKWIEGPALDVGASYVSTIRLANVINKGVIECVFESINGVGYMTQTGFSGEASELDLRHTFKKLDHNP